MLLDTAGLLSCLDRSDKRHQQAASLFRSARYRVTHSYVLAEFIALCRSRKLNAQLAIGFVETLMQDPLTEVLWVDSGLTEQALDLLKSRPDKTYSLCDAVSFVIMRLQGVQEALTTDRHFEQEGFARLLSS
jgi:predicted nucleic acid-binding protein